MPSTEKPSEPLRQMVWTVLSDQALGTINFDLKGLLVDWTFLMGVRNAVGAMRIKCFAGIPADSSLPAGSYAVAKYIANKENIGNLPPNQFRFPTSHYGRVVTGKKETKANEEKCTIVHESVHAAFDLYFRYYRSGNALAIDAEAAAHLAAAIYAQEKGYLMPDTNWIQDGAGDGARKLAARLPHAKDQWRKPRYVLSEKEIAALRDGVAVEYDYVKKADGDKSGTLHIFDGVP